VYDIGRVINGLKRFPLLPRSVGEQLTRFRLSLSAELVSHSTVFFSHNKSANVLSATAYQPNELFQKLDE